MTFIKQSTKCFEKDLHTHTHMYIENLNKKYLMILSLKGILKNPKTGIVVMYLETLKKKIQGFIKLIYHLI